MNPQYEREQFLNKPLPSAADAERCVLGGIILNNELISDAIKDLVPEDFYSPMHRQVFAAMIALFELNKTIDPILIGDELKKVGSIDSFGGVATISNLSYGLPHFTDISEWIALIREKAVLRQVIKTCNQITQTALAEEDSAENILADSEAMLAGCRRDENFADDQSFRETLISVLEDAKLRAQQKTFEMAGLPTGFRDLDEMLCGMEPADLIIIGARPSMGKTSLAINIVENVSSNKPEAVIPFFSLETSRKGIVQRFLLTNARVESHRFKSNYLARDDWGRLAETVGAIEGFGVELRTKPAITVLEMRAECRKIKRKKKRIDLIVVDFIQLMKTAKKTDNRREEISAIVIELKGLAVEFNVPVIALCQLSRKCEDRNPPRPVASDLKESGTIEEAADKILLLYRAEQYKHLASEENAGVAEIIVGKNRDGQTGMVKMAFLSAFTRFENFYE